MIRLLFNIIISLFFLVPQESNLTTPHVSQASWLSFSTNFQPETKEIAAFQTLTGQQILFVDATHPQVKKLEATEIEEEEPGNEKDGAVIAKDFYHSFYARGPGFNFVSPYRYLPSCFYLTTPPSKRLGLLRVILI